MTAKVYVIRNKFFNDNLADKMLRARKNQIDWLKEIEKAEKRRKAK